MNCARAKLFNRGEMLRCAIAFVFGETVAGELLVEIQHHPVARDLGKDTGGGDGIVDKAIIEDFVDDLIVSRDDQGKPNGESIEGYVAIIASFYKWAAKNGYSHYWTMDLESMSVRIKDGLMTDLRIVQERREVKVSRGTINVVRREVRAVVDNDSFVKWIKLLKKDDIVYALIAEVIRLTALRAKEVLQLPLQGVGLSAGLRQYREGEIDDSSNIEFEFDSKGKRRSIRFPGWLWNKILKIFIPIRAERALRYKAVHGVHPPPCILFLSQDGVPVSYKMLWNHFTKAGNHPESPRSSITAVTLRRSWATYFVLNALKQRGMLGKGYVYDAVVAEELRSNMGHEDVETTYKYYVKLANRFQQDDLLYDLQQSGNKALLRNAGFDV